MISMFSIIVTLTAGVVATGRPLESNALFQIRSSNKNERLSSGGHPAVIRPFGDHSCLGKMTRLVDGQWINGYTSLGNTQTPLDFPGPFQHGSSHQGLYVNENVSFAMCLMEKNACRAWSNILGKINRDDPKAEFSDSMNGLPQRAYEETDRAVTKTIFSNQTAVRAIFIRDPLARFASAFLDKCFGHCNDAVCGARDGADGGKAISFAQAIDWVIKPGNANDHFTPQSSRCDIKKRLHEYNIVALMQKSTLADDAGCVMDVAGIGRFNHANGNETGHFWRHHGEADGDKESTFHSTTRDDEEGKVLQRLFSKEKAEELMVFFKNDYELFNLPTPEWVKSATGELLHTVSNTCKPPGDFAL